MSTRRHYLKILPYLRDYALQVAHPDDWQKAVFDDITESGKNLTIEHLPPTEYGVRLGLCGDTYYCEATVDRERPDSIFVFKIDNAARRELKKVPTRYAAEFSLLTSRGGQAVALDSPQELWGIETIAKSPLDIFSSPANAATIPSEQLCAILALAPPDIRHLWRPAVKSGLQDASDAFLEQWRAVWLKFQLDRYRRLTPRQESLVKRLIPFPKVDPKERREIMSIFGIDLLNAYVRDQSDRTETLYELLRSLPLLPIPAETRAIMWASMVRSLKKDDFYRELYDAASRFQELSGLEESKVWSVCLIGVLTSLASTLQDPLLQQLVEDCRDEADPVAFLARWAVNNLEFEDTRSAKAKAAPTQVSATSESRPKAPPHIGTDVLDGLQPHQQRSSFPEGATTSTIRSKHFNEWLLILQALEPKQVKLVVEEVKASASHLANLASDCSIEGLATLVMSLSVLADNLQHWMGELPDPARLAKDYDEGIVAYDEALKLIGEDIDRILSEGVLTPEDIQEAVALSKRQDVLRSVPNWVWEGTSDLSATDNLAMFRRLLVRNNRERIISVLSSVGESGSYDTALLRLLPPPATGLSSSDLVSPSWDQHIQTWLTNMRKMWSELPDGARSTLATRSASSNAETQTRLAVETYRKLSGRVSQPLIEQILSAIITDPDESATTAAAEKYLEAVDFWEKHFGSAHDAGFPQLKSWIQRQPKQPTGARESSSGSGNEIQVEHNLMDAQGTRVPLLFTPATDQTTRPYGYVAAPFVIVCRQRRPCIYKIDCEVKTGHRDGWSKQWENPEPSEVAIPEEAWRDDPDQPGQYLNTFRLKVPIRRKGRGERFEFQLTITDKNTGKLACEPKMFSWDFISDAPREQFVLAWSETLDPEKVEKHPLGPQKKSREILKRLDQNGSFCVTAPRRFGKSTLVEFLRAKAQDLGFVVPPAVICTNHFMTGQGVDYEKLWQTLSDNLQLELGSSLVRPAADGVPGENAFDHVRRSAWKQGKKGVVVLFDEAQTFFPSKTGPSLGDLIKDRLERHWSSPRQEMAPVMFGFIGLPTLQERAGVNLMGLLRPVAHNDLEEAELNSVILAVTSNSLRTTREARRRLARTAANIYILRTLVTHLGEHIQEDGRQWANFDDVIDVETTMRTKLRDAQEPIVSSYIRDILNDAENVNLWKPNAAMLLAMAIADTKYRLVPHQRLYEEAKNRIKAWYDAISNNGNTRLSYEEQQFQEHLTTLHERGLLRNREFTSVLLGDWLIGFTKQVSDQEWRSLLHSAAIKRISIPASMQKVIDAEGAEATVWTTAQDQIKYAYRVTQLHTEDDRVRFTETRDILENLKLCLAEGTPGSQYIFRLSDVGLSADNDSEAVQVYRWVEGIDLSRRVAQLPATYVADLGAKLASALQFLHSANIIHRDLSPRNIVVADETGDPVIIDFGFARRLTPDVKSSINSDYAAPEVRRIQAKWTKAADIYSLGATLLSILVPRDACGHLLNVLKACMDEDPDKRPDAIRLAVGFEDVIKELHVDTRRADTWDRVQKICQRDYNRVSWFKGLLDKFRGTFISTALGCYPSAFDRCRTTADFLNQVLEASSAKHPDSKLTLGRIKDENPVTGKTLATEAIRFMHSIRKYHSHGEYGGKVRATAKFGELNDSQMLVLANEAAAQISAHVATPSILDLTRLLLIPEPYQTSFLEPPSSLVLANPLR